MSSLPSSDDLSTEAMDAVDDRLAELNRIIAGHRDGSKDGATALQEIRQTAHSLKGLGQSFGLALLKVLAHRLEDFLMEAKALDEQLDQDVQAFVDRIAEAAENKFDAGPEEIAAFVRKLPAKGQQTKFEVSDVRVSEIEVMLVMEPSTGTRFVTRELQECGYRMTNVWSPIDAFQLVPHIRPDLVIVSNVMRDLSGVDFCCALKAMPVSRDIPVALLTSEKRGSHALVDLPADVPVVSKSRNFGDDVTQVFSDLGLL